MPLSIASLISSVREVCFTYKASFMSWKESSGSSTEKMPKIPTTKKQYKLRVIEGITPTREIIELVGIGCCKRKFVSS